MPDSVTTRARRNDDAAHQVLREFRVIFGAVRRHFASVERAAGIGGAQLWALAVVAQRPGLRVSDLAAALSIHQSTASNLLQRLVREGLAVRRRDASDHRVVRLDATPKGRRLVALAPQPFSGVLPDALGRLPARTLARLSVDLRSIIRAMQRKDPRAAYIPLADL